jgi:hypothetical protein
MTCGTKPRQNKLDRSVLHQYKKHADNVHRNIRNVHKYIRFKGLTVIGISLARDNGLGAHLGARKSNHGRFVTIMHEKFYKLLSSTLLILACGAISFGQDTQKQVVVHPDGSYTVIEYPVGKEVNVTLLPGTSVTGKGSARVVRSASGTKVYFDVNGVPADTSSYYAYAIDPSGAATLLGPVTFNNGSGKAEFTTPLSQFMLVLSPTEGLTTYDPTTAVVFRSEVPKGYVVVPHKMTGDTRATAMAASDVGPYDVPLLNVPSFSGKTKEVKIKFSGDLTGLEGKAYLDRKGDTTKVKMHFDDMKKVPANKRFVLWASSPDGHYTKLGQVVNTGTRSEAEITSETNLSDFGLFVTVEDADVMTPTSRTYSVFSPGF